MRHFPEITLIARHNHFLKWVAAVWVLTSALAVSGAAAQEGVPAAVEVPAGSPMPPGAPRVKSARPMPVPGQPTGAPGQPGQPGQPGDKPADPNAKPGEPVKPEGPKVTTRPAKPAAPPNPEELKVRPDKDGMVRFNFHGQPWLDVLEWLASISELSLDWQELPGDFLNLRTQRRYTVDEARDLINRHLLDRGFTILKNGEVLTVANTKKLDPSLVPRVAPAELEERDPHEFVKVSFPLESLTAETAVEELKPMLSPNGKLTALKATNRIETVDAVINLREVYAVLKQEQSAQGRQRLVKEFKLQHVRADDVLEQLQTLLGLEPSKPKAAGGGGDQNAQMQRMAMMQMEMQQRGGGGQPQPPQAKPAPTVNLVVNQRENSILANAPANQMAIIAEAVKVIDVPSERANGLLRNMNRMQVYRLAQVDPEVLVKVLQENGDLDPTTRVQADKKNRSIIANASLADHVTIRTLVNKLDGTDRKFEVIKLRRLEADYVAGTIEFMMGGGGEKKQNNNRRQVYYDFIPFGYGGSGGREQEDDSRRFRVDADVDNNRLLLWANAIEMAEVENLLVKLGEIPPQGGNPATQRVLDTLDPEDAEKLLERIRRVWPGISPNQLRITPSERAPREEASPTRGSTPAETKPAVRQKSTPTDASRGSHRSRKVLAAMRPAAKAVQVAQFEEKDSFTEDAEESDDSSAPPAQPGDDPQPESKPEASEKVPAAEPTPNEEEPSATNRKAVSEIPPVDETPRLRKPSRPAPVDIRIGPDGRIMISSDDTEALDRLEDLLSEMAPPRKDYKVFKMKYHTTWAYGVALNLKEYFEDQEKKGNNRSTWNPFYGGYMPSGSNTDDTRKLSKRKPLKFIADSDSNSILIVGADANQLKIIEELISLYDVPPDSSDKAVRQTRIFTVKYSKAKVIGDTLKDVYRDLLSANDPALQNNQNNQKNQKPGSGSGVTYVYNSNSANDDQKPDSPLKFKGMLSIGVDELSNTLVVSAAENMMENIALTIQALDVAAKPTVSRMQVLQVNRHLSAEQLQQKLNKLVPKPQQQPQRQPGQPQQPQQPQQNFPGGPGETVIINE